MKFASAKQILFMIVASAAFLYGLDYWKNPQLWHSEVSASTARGELSTPEVTLWINESYSPEQVRGALNGLQGLEVSKSVVTVDTTHGAESRTSAAIPVTDVAKLDFSALDRALRQNGIVASRMELSGVPHFGLQAEFSQFPVQVKSEAVEERIEFIKAQQVGGLREWLDSVDLDTDHKSLTAYARYVESGKSVDVSELVNGLSQMGLAPNALHVVMEESHHHDHDHLK